MPGSYLLMQQGAHTAERERERGRERERERERGRERERERDTERDRINIHNVVNLCVSQLSLNT